ncbi:MAG: acylneuraminate cytidylyltransferase family protein [Lachnospiraceae bacterium]|jgi:CMP-N-acetylneuraminic acid synthetase|nr:acylneuraminate cytidylyltransferase family protein [Lachnospiraceae bacterium]
MKVVALVPIKLNSQRLPHKNILPILGKPMCYHMVDSLVQTKNIDEVYVYCSDPKVTEYIPEGATFLQRDKKLDQDLVKGFEIYRSFIETVDADVYVLAHTTSPFTKTETIENALSHILSGECDSAFSAERVQTFAWYQGKAINYDLNDVPRTQDMEPIWVETSAFYMFKKEIFTEHNRRIGFHPYIQEVSGIEAVDIDTKQDYDFAVEMSKQLETDI